MALITLQLSTGLKNSEPSRSFGIGADASAPVFAFSVDGGNTNARRPPLFFVYFESKSMTKMLCF